MMPSVGSIVKTRNYLMLMLGACLTGNHPTHTTGHEVIPGEPRYKKVYKHQPKKYITSMSLLIYHIDCHIHFRDDVSYIIK